MVWPHLTEISNAGKELGLCPWAAGSPGKILSKRGSIRAALWKTLSGCCTEELEETEATVGNWRVMRVACPGGVWGGSKG